MSSIAEKVGEVLIAKDNVVFAEVVESKKGSFHVMIEQYDPETNNDQNPSMQFLAISPSELPELIKLLQKTFRRASALSAAADL